MFGFSQLLILYIELLELSIIIKRMFISLALIHKVFHHLFIKLDCQSTVINVFALIAVYILFRMELDSIERKSSSFIAVHKLFSILIISFTSDLEHSIDLSISCEFSWFKAMIMVISKHFVFLDPIESTI